MGAQQLDTELDGAKARWQRLTAPIVAEVEAALGFAPGPRTCELRAATVPTFRDREGGFDAIVSRFGLEEVGLARLARLGALYLAPGGIVVVATPLAGIALEARMALGDRGSGPALPRTASEVASVLHEAGLVDVAVEPRSVSTQLPTAREAAELLRAGGHPAPVEELAKRLLGFRTLTGVPLTLSFAVGWARRGT